MIRTWHKSGVYTILIPKNDRKNIRDWPLGLEEIIWGDGGHVIGKVVEKSFCNGDIIVKLTDA